MVSAAPILLGFARDRRHFGFLIFTQCAERHALVEAASKH